MRKWLLQEILNSPSKIDEVKLGNTCDLVLIKESFEKKLNMTFCTPTVHKPLRKRRKISDSDDTSDTCSETSTAEDDDIFGDVHMLVPTFLARTVPQEDFLYTFKTQEQLYVQTLRGMLYSGDGPPNRDGGIERATIHSALKGAEKRLLSIAAYPGQSAYAQKLETARTLKEQPTPPDTWPFTHSMIVQEILFYLQSLAVS